MTNNVLATRFDARSDAGPQVTPKIRVDSDWNRHSLSFEANADRIWYSEFPIADVKNYQVLTRGRLDVTRRTRLFGEVEKSHVEEGPSSISITDIATSGTTALDEQHATAAIEHTFNRLTMKLTGTVADYNYSDTSDPALIGDLPFVDVNAIRKSWARCVARMSSSHVGRDSSRPPSTSETTGSRSPWRDFAAAPRATPRWPG